MRIAVLDDYQRVARSSADWSALEAVAEVEVFHDHLTDEGAVAARLCPFDAIVAMRERTPLGKSLLERLPKLRVIASTGSRNAAIDEAYAAERGIDVLHTGYDSNPTIEHTWALILAGARNIVQEAGSVRAGGWQVGLGTELRGKTLALLGLGRIGGEVARIGKAFGMHVIAWSQNLTAEQAAEHGATRVEKEELFRRADFLSVHLVLSKRTQGLVDAEALSWLKPTARLVNTSRGPIVDEAALLDALRHERLGGAMIDVFETEPLAADHPFRTLPNVLVTPHVGYVTAELYRVFYQDSVDNLVQWQRAHEKE